MTIESDPSRWCVGLLGGLEIGSPNGPVEVPLASQRVVIYLTLNRRLVRRATVAAILWPDLDEVRARANLRSALWRLKQVTPMVVATADAIRLDGQVQVDLDRIDRGLKEIRNGDSERGSAGLAMLDLELLPGWDDPWITFERERIRQRQLHLLDQVICNQVAGGCFGDAIDTALRALKLDRFRESTHAALLEAHVAGGNRAAAVTHYKDFATKMRIELGLSPSAELNKRFRELLR